MVSPRTPTWASERCEIPADDIRQLARRMAAVRTLVTVTWSLQRIPHGEQPVWAGLALAALLGQIGSAGRWVRSWLRLDGRRRVDRTRGRPAASSRRAPTPSATSSRSPVSPTCCCRPVQTFTYDGGTHTYPDIRLVYWAGGNPFHHHQDLGRLRQALAATDTVVVNEPYWTAMARHADIVLPTTIPTEREDFGAGRRDTHLNAMHRATSAPGEALDDHEIFRRIAERMGVGDHVHRGPDATRSGWNISTRSGGRVSAVPFRRSTSSGPTVGWRCRTRQRT